MDFIIDWLRHATENKAALDHLSNMVIPLFSFIGVYIGTSVKIGVRRFGFFLGLVSQPFWFYLAFTSFSLGLVVNSVFFTGLWVCRLVQANRILRED